MNNNPQGFSFPPPPPPPPSSQRQHQPPHQPPHQQHPHPQQQYHHGHNAAAYPSQYGAGYHGQQRGGRAPGAHHRGRGRGGYGNHHRGGGGGRGGSHYMTPDVNVNRGYSTANVAAAAGAGPVGGYTPMNYAGYTPQPLSATPQAVSTSQFAPSRSPNFQHRTTTTPSFTPPPQPYASASLAHVPPPYQPQPNYPAAAAQPAPTYPPAVPTHNHVTQPVQPQMMGPPMRWGFDNSAPAGVFPGGQRGHQRGGRSFNNYNTQPDKQMNHGNKRDHNSAFGRPPQASAPRVAAPPPVPSFGNPLLPSKPPPPAEAARKPKKKKRKHNQLGLTPKTEEHESSEEEDDVDEEARLAAVGGAAGASASAPLQVTYRGRTSTLQTSEDIKAWIEERKKRFPTQARVEEKKKAMEEAKKARDEALRQKKLQRQEQNPPQKDAKNQKGREQLNHKDQRKDSKDPVDIAAKAKLKADKLRRKLMREEKRVARAEADAERARMRVEELQKSSTNTATEQDQPDAPMENASESQIKPPEPTTTPASGPGVEETAPAIDPKPDAAGTHAGDAASVSSLDDSDSSDWTSSSGSDSSSEDSDGSDNDSAPEEATSKREGPERVPPPARETKKKVLCRHFARRGRCKHGDKCKFSHELPERGTKAKPTEQKGRKGLLQALLDRQKTEDDRKVMEAIVWLGENGMLDAPKESGDNNDASSAAGDVKTDPGNEDRQNLVVSETTAPGQGGDAAAPSTA
ncbi:CCCH zinc finger protein [Aspergillus homomorphus CBS 101889]|uniref:C3H1-type domain-containing protein n=1 Tax=Aspergillus homomorphus (strain CBS 101889) TaxID=1450537 RepID=A0A395HJ22_ASPHC|nr:hypothetical protein BO97DRAFT_446857 [Aspergillus homomorphus CBS 101889]RAL07433.1 hypothetical protein BO97DRAFT_446857 [Aspergillus homomorphus CBS 101889]